MKIGRNDPCPCKSGKKAKQCCGTNRIQVQPGTLAVSADTSNSVSSDKCFLCTAPELHTREDGRVAYLSGFIHGVTMERPPLCHEHEIKLREMLAPYVQDEEVYKKLGIRTLRL